MRSRDAPPAMTEERLVTTAEPGRLALLHSPRVAYLLLLIAPAFFASNMLTARATHDLIPPVALAFWRWTATLVILLPVTAVPLWRNRAAVRQEWLDLLILGALGMGVCGAFVYIGADTTTATNIGLIYAASPVLIIVLAHFFYGETMVWRQGLGVGLSLLGVLVIVCRGDLEILVKLRFTVGDLWILAAMVGWSVYSILLRYRPSKLGLTPRFAAICLGGVISLLPFYLWESAQGQVAVFDLTTVGVVAFLAIVASIGAYQIYGLVQKSLGAGRTGLIMYLIPLYNAGLAYLLLGETLRLYHLIGACLVLPGIFMATRGARDRNGP